jgi:hypothetical protein
MAFCKLCVAWVGFWRCNFGRNSFMELECGGAYFASYQTKQRGLAGSGPDPFGYPTRWRSLLYHAPHVAARRPPKRRLTIIEPTKIPTNKITRERGLRKGDAQAPPNFAQLGLLFFSRLKGNGLYVWGIGYAFWGCKMALMADISLYEWAKFVHGNDVCPPVFRGMKFSKPISPRLPHPAHGSTCAPMTGSRVSPRPMTLHSVLTDHTKTSTSNPITSHSVSLN